MRKIEQEELFIIKRNGDKVLYDGNKVVTVIKKAMGEGKTGINLEIAMEIEQDIFEEISSDIHQTLFTVENLQDLVETGLMKHGRYGTAKRYILKRDEKNRLRRKSNSDENVEEYIYLTDDYISQFKHLDDPLSPIGSLTFYRTYSRWLHKSNRREKWFETVRRSVEYNISLVPPKSHESGVMEAKELFENIYNLRQFLSGRTLYSGNTKVTRQFPTANYNCSFRLIDGTKAFVDTFYLLLIGSGVGFRQLFVDLDKLEKFNIGLDVIHSPYKSKLKGQRKELSELSFNQFGTIATLTVGDSKLGWIKALEFLLMLFTDKAYISVDSVLIDYDNVRPQGEKLISFGGNASGHNALLNIFENIFRVVQLRGKEIGKTDGYIKLKPIDALDIQTGIAEGVVVGGTRRSAEICLVDAKDNESIQSKSELFVKVGDKWVADETIKHRAMANNSIYYTRKPTREKLHEQIETMRYSGEPAWVNAEAGSKRRDNFNGVNPCGS